MVPGQFRPFRSSGDSIRNSGKPRGAVPSSGDSICNSGEPRWIIYTVPGTWNLWSDLPAGEYVFCVGIASRDLTPCCDYHWAGLKISEDYKVVVK